MNKILRTVSLVGALAFVGLAPTEASAQGCCSPVTSYRMGSGRSTAGRPWLSTRPTGGRTGRMSRQSMNLSGMNMNGVAYSHNMASASAASTAPAVRGAAYFCPMHPNVVSTSPATCPYCQMALQRR